MTSPERLLAAKLVRLSGLKAAVNVYQRLETDEGHLINDHHLHSVELSLKLICGRLADRSEEITTVAFIFIECRMPSESFNVVRSRSSLSDDKTRSNQ